MMFSDNIWMEPSLEQILSLIRIGLSLLFLIYASWSDFKTREVSNRVWMFFAPFAFLLTLTQFLFYPPPFRFLFLPNLDITVNALVNYGISFAVTSIFSIALFYVGAFGGADAKALMCLALVTPLPPSLITPLSGFVSFVFPITIFSNGVIIATLSVFYALSRNLMWKLKKQDRLFAGYEKESVGRKALALVCGYKVAVAYLKKSFLYPLEDISIAENSEVKKRLLLFPKDENREQMIERIVKAEKEGKIKNEVWATPGLPMLIFITIGFILSLTLGDIVWIVISQIL